VLLTAAQPTIAKCVLVSVTTDLASNLIVKW